MKTKLILPLLLLTSTFSLVGCNQGSNTSTSGDNKPLTINFYVDYNHYEPEEPYYVAKWYYDRPFTKEDLGLTDPACPDEYYSKFLGWSLHTLLDGTEGLWKFGEDSVSRELAVGEYVNLFGIWVRE